MDISQQCFLTGMDAPWTEVSRRVLPSGATGYLVRSVICGNYLVDADLCGPEADRPQMISYLKSIYHPRLHLLAAYALQRSAAGQPVEFRKDRMPHILGGIYVPSGPLEQIDMILAYLYDLYRRDYRPFEFLEIYTHPLLLDMKYPIACARHPDEFAWLVTKALEFGYLETDVPWSAREAVVPPRNIRLSIKGFERMRELDKNEASNRVFVAMSFQLAAEDPDVYNLGIEQALAANDYVPLFLREEEHNEKIDDKIIVEIRRSKFVVVDITYHRQNVYFEGGFALGEGIPVVWTCRADNWEEEKAHFDIRQYNHLLWDTPADLKRKLQMRIEATFGKFSRYTAGGNN